MQKKIVLATSNMNKVIEFQEMLSDLNIEFLPQRVFSIPEVPETGLTFVENAIIKARHASLKSNLPAIADDSGLEVDALNGEPGIYSARYGGEPVDFQANIAKLLRELADVPLEERTARFQCVLVYMRHEKDPTPLICQGTWEGRILLEPKGSKGFGYDPIFYVPTHDCSAAELDMNVKNQVSHRGQALHKLRECLIEKEIVSR